MLPGLLSLRRLAVLVLGPALLSLGGVAGGPPLAPSFTPPPSASPLVLIEPSAPAASAATSTSDLPAGSADRLERLADLVVDAGAPGVVLARRDGGHTTRIARGVADLRTDRAARPDDRYRIGSNTKTMTAVVVLQLVAEGRLGLDDKVVRWLPDLGLDPALTVRHLLQQTSGLRTDTMVFTPPRTYENVRYRYFGSGELVRLALTNPEPRPAPGTAFEYSNTNYVLAGMVIEKVTHHPARVELARRIFRPLGMTDTSFPVASPFVTGSHLRGYLPLTEGEEPYDTTTYSMSWLRTAGAVISTTRDETTFLRALFTGRLLPTSLLTQMMDADTFGYGLGLFPVEVPCVPGGVVWGHNGAVFGYDSATFSTPDGSRQASIGANTWLLDAAGELSPLTAQVAAAALCDDVPDPATLRSPQLTRPSGAS
ncbi:serine hydrolase domain-containing protein [Actinopolymorpha pittospori]